MADVADYVVSVEALSTTLVRVRFNTRIVLDNAYYSKANYSLQPVFSSLEDVLILQVLPVYEPTSKERATFHTELILSTTRQNTGTVYSLNVGALRTASGTTLEGYVYFVAKHTKQDAVVLPSYLDPRQTSVVATIMRAIAIADDAIGGSVPDHSFPIPGYLVVDEDGYFLTDDDGYILIT